MNRPSFAAVVLAGGLSTRMKQLKPLLPLGKTTVLNHILETFRQAAVDVLLVTGYRHEEIEASVKRQSITKVFNPDYEQGMFTSVRAGVRELEPEYRAFFILPADIPLVTVDTIKELTSVSLKNPHQIVYPVYLGKRGHPPLIPSSIIPAILGWDKGGGLKAVLESLEKRALEVPVSDKYILFDIDTPEDYGELLNNYKLI